MKSLNKTTEAITALTNFIDASPTDAEAWAELSDLYVSQGMYPQGIFALEEVLLITPNAWNVSTTLEHRVSEWPNADSYRCMLVWEKFCLWLPVQPTLVRTSTLSNRFEDSVGVSNCVMTTFGVSMD